MYLLKLRKIIFKYSYHLYFKYYFTKNLILPASAAISPDIKQILENFLTLIDVRFMYTKMSLDLEKIRNFLYIVK